MRAYIRVDPELADRKCHYPDGALSAFVLTLCFAEQQPQRGYFKPNVLKALLERRARWIPYLIEHGDLEDRNGRLYFVGWDEWQEGDWKVHERVKRIRERRTVTPTVTKTVTPVTVVTVNTPSEPLAVGGRRLAVSESGRQPDGGKTPVENPNGLRLRVESRGHGLTDMEPMGGILRRGHLAELGGES